MQAAGGDGMLVIKSVSCAACVCYVLHVCDVCYKHMTCGQVINGIEGRVALVGFELGLMSSNAMKVQNPKLNTNPDPKP